MEGRAHPLTLAPGVGKSPDGCQRREMTGRGHWDTFMESDSKAEERKEGWGRVGQTRDAGGNPRDLLERGKPVGESRKAGQESLKGKLRAALG